ncbi:MAG: hypothetical protein AMXMBFR46_19170 [Acidimicrobiia bacterium]
MGVAAFALLSGGGDDKASADDREVLLEAAASAGPAPFTPDLQPVATSVPSSSTSTSTVVTTTTVAPPPAAGPGGRVAAGPFGGTGDNSLCDRELLVEFLTDPANAAIAREWARVLDVRVIDIPTFVRALIPTTLSADARVTNHRWENGRAVGYQAVLERGTAVLVDVNGRLVARCRCGNPLLEPQEVPGPPIYVGPKWTGFDPTVIVVVVPAPQPIYPPGGAGTLPPPSSASAPSTTPTTRGSSTPTTRAEREADLAIAKIKPALERCTRGGPLAGVVTPAEFDQVLAGLTYTAALTDQRTGTYRVTVTAPAFTTASGAEFVAETATWDVNLRDNEITPVDANAQSAASSCPALA